MKQKPTYIKTMDGIGDNIYLRPHIKELAKSNKIILETVLPDLYRDIPNVEFVEAYSQYRTQKKVESTITKFVDRPDYAPLEPFYTGKDLLTSNVTSSFARQLNVPLDAKFEWTLPDFFTSHYIPTGYRIPIDKKIAVIRPATLRREWLVRTRNADPLYIAWCAAVLKDYGYHVIAIADLEKNKEWLYNEVDVVADEKLYAGELGLYATLQLIQMADIVVGGSGFILPATASAEKTKLFTIFGGRMAYDNPQKLFHPTMNLEKIGYSVPDHPCRCTLDEHDCNKFISNLDSDFFRFLTK